MQGERRWRDTRRLALSPDGPSAAPRGVPQIEVGFDIDANASACQRKDLHGKSQKITITASSGLSKDEVEKMKKEAEAHAEEDKKLRENVELKNRSDARVYETEK